MYKIILFTWYQETPDKIYEEVYHNLGFTTLQQACEYLGKNIESILDEFPVTYITIKYNEKHPKKEKLSANLKLAPITWFTNHVYGDLSMIGKQFYTKDKGICTIEGINHQTETYIDTDKGSVIWRYQNNKEIFIRDSNCDTIDIKKLDKKFDEILSFFTKERLQQWIKSVDVKESTNQP